MNSFLSLAAAVVQAYMDKCNADDKWAFWFTSASLREHLSDNLSGWWVIQKDENWWWLGVYDKCPVGQDFETFPHCWLDCPLPDADFSSFLESVDANV